MKSLEVLLVFFSLGLTSFGGPTAHLGFFRDEFVEKKKWIDDRSYGELVGLCQFLPGPASSQVGMAIGFYRSGISGAILAWIGFTLPSAIILIIFGLGVTHFDLSAHRPWLHGLKVVAVSVVAQAIWGMGKKLTPDLERISIAVISCAVVLFTNSSLVQILVLVTAGLYGSFFLKTRTDLPHVPMGRTLPKKMGALFLITFIFILLLLPLLSALYPTYFFSLFESFYRAGALVFGGGHVVLPLLQAEIVPNGWVTNDVFMAGYGLANAIPGPLFAFSAYLGAVSRVQPNGWVGGMLSLIAAFLPSFFLIMGTLPFWETLRSIPKIRQSMLGVNASVVGILLAAFYHPVWTSAIFSIKDLAIAVVGFLLLEKFKQPSWLVVIYGVVISMITYGL